MTIAFMTAAYRVVVAERKEIAMATLACPECGSELSLNMETAKIPQYCASCDLPFETATKEALAALGRFHRLAATAEEHAGKPVFRFQIREKD